MWRVANGLDNAGLEERLQKLNLLFFNFNKFGLKIAGLTNWKSTL